MASVKQGSRQGKGRDIVSGVGEENHTNLVSELGEGGMSSSSNSEEFAQICKVQYQLLAVVSNMSAKLELLLQSKIDGLGNREGIGTIHERGVVMGMGRDDPLQGTHVERPQDVHLVYGRPQVVHPASGRVREDVLQGIPDRQPGAHPISAGTGRPYDDWLRGMHRQEQQEEPLFHWGNRLETPPMFFGGRFQQGFQQGFPRGGMARVRQKVRDDVPLADQTDAYEEDEEDDNLVSELIPNIDHVKEEMDAAKMKKENFMNRCGASISAGDPHPRADDDDDDGFDFDYGTLQSKKKGFKLKKLDFNFNGPGGFDLDMGFSKENKSEKNNELHYNLNDTSDKRIMSLAGINALALRHGVSSRLGQLLFLYHFLTFCYSNGGYFLILCNLNNFGDKVLVKGRVMVCIK